jgi:hypothetical protein
MRIQLLSVYDYQNKEARIYIILIVVLNTSFILIIYNNNNVICIRVFTSFFFKCVKSGLDERVIFTKKKKCYIYGISIE